MIIASVSSFRGISEQRAIGLGAVAGGLAEAYVTSGFILTFVFEVAAIVLLIRSLSRGHLGRGFVAVISICWSALVLFLFGDVSRDGLDCLLGYVRILQHVRYDRVPQIVWP
jgi:hypothetical protein